MLRLYSVCDLMGMEHQQTHTDRVKQKYSKKTHLPLWPCLPKNATWTFLGLNPGFRIHRRWQITAWAMAKPITKARTMKQMRHIHKWGLCEVLQDFNYELEKTIIDNDISGRKLLKWIFKNVNMWSKFNWNDTGDKWRAFLNTVTNTQVSKKWRIHEPVCYYSLIERALF